MPIYEYYCPDCHTLFSFLAAGSTRRKRPACPRCHRPNLDRRPSTFAMPKPGSIDEESDDNPFAGADEARIESAMEALGGEMERLGDTEDPRAMGQLLRRFGELSGLDLGPRMEDALQRMEAGEDPDAIESELGDEDDDSLDGLFELKRSLRRARRPAVDDQLYFL